MGSRQASFLVEIGSGGTAPVQRLLESLGYRVLGWTDAVRAEADASVVKEPASGDSTHRRDEGSTDLTDDANAFYARFFADCCEGILTTGTSGNVVFCNRSAAQLFGWDEAEMLGRPLESLIPTWTQISAAARAESNSGLPTPNHRVYGQRKDGTRFPASVSMAGGGGDGSPQITLIRDISENESLLELALEAKKMQSLGLLAASAAHDLNNALMALRAQVFLAAKQPHRVRALEECGAIIDRCSRLTEGLLTFASPDAPRLGRTDLNCAVAEALRMVRTLLPRNIAIATHWASQTAWVAADADQITHAVVNLILNARDAMPDGGVLTVRTKRNAGGLQQLIVEDTGHGMSGETLGRAFEPFFTTKPPGRGTGLGLHAVRSIVERASGSVDITSAAGQGCRVTISLPVPEPWEVYEIASERA